MSSNKLNLPNHQTQTKSNTIIITLNPNKRMLKIIKKSNKNCK